MTETFQQKIARCRREQQECQQYLLTGGPDVRGAQQGLEDWVAEEIELERAEAVTPCIPPREGVQ